MKTVQITVINEVGLHARPAALFVKTAARFKSKIQVRNVTSGGNFVDAKSILSVLTTGVEKNHQIEVSAEGEDEAEAVAAIDKLIQSDFSA